MTGLSVGWADILRLEPVRVRSSTSAGLPDGRYCLRDGGATRAGALDGVRRERTTVVRRWCGSRAPTVTDLARVLLGESLSARPRPSPVAGHHVDQRVVGRGACAVMPSRPVMRLGGDERVQDRFLGGLDRGPEQVADRGVGQHRDVERARRRLVLVAARSGRGSPVENARKRSPLECSPAPPTRAMPRPGALREALDWWGSSGASVARITMIDPAPGRRARAGSSSSTATGTTAGRDLAADRHAVDREALAAAVVRLHERADGPVAVRRRP